MSTENEAKPKTSSTSSSSSTPSIAGVPAAIVVAGGLIAVAIYFSGGGGALPAGSRTPTAGENQPGGQPAAPAQPAAVDIAPVTEKDHIRGASNAKITLVEYSDFECPFCKRFHPTVKQLLDEYPNDVRWVYRHFPLEQIHPNARGAALASECAAEQGRFWELVDIMFDEGTTADDLVGSNLANLAQQAGVTNASQFQSCLDSEKYADDVDADAADAQAAGGRGTPYSIIVGPDGENIPVSGAQPYESVKATIDSLL